MLHRRKKNKNASETDGQRVHFQKLLIIREKQEEEERKKRCDDEEENKYDIGSHLTDPKKWKPKAGKFNYHRRPTGSFKGTALLGLEKATKKVQLTNLISSDGKDIADHSKTPVKKKAPQNRAANTDMDVKVRKSSMMLGVNSKEDPIKRY